MTFEKLSEKQTKVLRWCYENEYDNIICDGAVRSGKTSVMSISFVLWAMHYFNDCDFALCGKTVRSCERNLILPLQSIADITAFYDVSYKRSINVMTVSGNGKENRFYIFGGKDESSYTLIQGITLCGVLLDEVALMPRSFVEQAIARTLSVKSSKVWFNCNPESPMHWFYLDWILQAEEKKALHLHFTMHDNPIMTEEAIEKAEGLYKGVFYDRYIKGLWVQAEGLIYPEQARGRNVVPTAERKYTTYYASVDYGTLNPFSVGLWGFCEADGIWYRTDEYYYDGRKENVPKTDGEYLSEFKKLCSGRRIKAVVVDPSAASFITLLKKSGFFVKKAENSVVDGIRLTADMFANDKIMINDCCKSAVKELGLYRWDEKAAEDRPIKENDHAMDDIRYFCATVLAKPEVKIKRKPKGF